MLPAILYEKYRSMLQTRQSLTVVISGATSSRNTDADGRQSRPCCEGTQPEPDAPAYRNLHMFHHSKTVATEDPRLGFSFILFLPLVLTIRQEVRNRADFFSTTDP